MSLPEPLITRMPVAVALHIPPEFSTFTQKEKRSSVQWEISLGKAQTEGFTRLLNAMFERVIVVDSIEAATRGEPVRAILEPMIDEYNFVTPRDAGASFFAVSIKYRMGIYTPDGKLADSWAFTGYGSAPTAGMSDEDSLHRATTLALRDAAAKLAVEFRDQEIVRELLPGADAHGTAREGDGETAGEDSTASEAATETEQGAAPAEEGSVVEGTEPAAPTEATSPLEARPSPEATLPEAESSAPTAPSELTSSGS